MDRTEIEGSIRGPRGPKKIEISLRHKSDRRYLEPYTKIGGNEMHEAKPCCELSSVDVHLLVEKDKVHLEEDKHQLETWSQKPANELSI